jgi:glyoxylase-like metal-dependent hydrolase (beta-lactamase superfamily II)
MPIAKGHQEEIGFFDSKNLVLTLRMESGPFINHSYIILDRPTGRAAVVDPSWDLNKITERLEDLDARLTMILLTHAHYDHVNLVPPLIEKFGPQVVISSAESDFYRFSCENMFLAGHLDEIKLGESKIRCLLTPGHTAGGMCYLMPHSIFTGDTVFIEGCGTCAEKGGSAESMFESFDMMRQTVASHVQVFPGHSYGSPVGCGFGSLLKDNIYFQFNRKDQFVRFRMRDGQTGLFSFNSRK